MATIEEKNLRTAKRVDVDLRTVLQGDIDADGSDTFMSNLGQGGCFIRTEHPLTVGSPLGLSIELGSKGSPVTARGIVRWVRETSEAKPRGMGIQFTDIAPDDLIALKQYIEERLMEELFN